MLETIAEWDLTFLLRVVRICNENIPPKLRNTVSEYVLTKKDVIGVSDEPKR